MRAALVFFTLIAFAAQAFATQTHIHFTPQELAALNGDAPGGLPHKGDPSKDDPANCPVCQQIALAGNFVSPAPILFHLPTQITVLPEIVFAQFVLAQSVSHNWRGRAPPDSGNL